MEKSTFFASRFLHCMNEKNDKVNNLISYICDDLDIEKPQLTILDSMEGTMLAYYDAANDILAVKDSYKSDYDMVFAVAHELRHKYQYVNKLLQKPYKSREQLSVFDYNMQIQELDANAYAYIFLDFEFGVKPLFNGLDNRIVQAIIDRANYILNTEY